MTESAGLTRAHVFISGRVQGVSFRYYTARQAEALGLTGWVRNLPDRRVEAVFEGTERDVQHMLRWCVHGPPSATVDRVEVNWEQPERTHRSFKIIP